MIQLYVATGDELAVISRGGDRWQAKLQLTGLPTQCIAVDPLRPEVAYCGTFGEGLWRSQDAGASWERVGEGIPHAEVMAVAVSPLQRGTADGVVWAGTEPSAVFRSGDDGRSWQERPALRNLPSAPTWSFPPRPWTHHVRWIAPDPVAEGRLFVAIELGGVMRSLDGGVTWEDRKPGSQPDAHTLATHPLAPGRVYEAAGGGYAESRTGGAAWKGDDDGLEHFYLWGLAVDPADPETVVVSAARGPYEAHDPSGAHSTIYRRARGERWHEVRDGLPAPRGRRVMSLAAHAPELGVFYAAAQEGDLYRSADAGRSWQRLEVAWPQGYRYQHVHGLVAVAVD